MPKPIVVPPAQKPSPVRYLVVCTLFLLLLLAGASTWARILVQQQAHWTPHNWAIDTSAPIVPQIQAGLDAETATNSAIKGQAMAVHAPRLGLDHVWVSGPNVRADDAIRVASNIKPFVAAAALKLVEQGRLSLDAPIGPFLSPQMASLFKSQPDVLRDVTLRHLLNHSSGLRDYGDSKLFQALAYVPTAFGWSWHWTPEVEVWFAARTLPIAPVGSGFAYADTNYLLASDMIAKASGQANAGLALRALLDWPRIGAPRTYWEGYETPPTPTRIARHFRGGIEDTHLDVSFDQYGGGGLVMPIADLAHAHRAVVLGVVFARPEATRAWMQTPGTAPETGTYALGLSQIMIEDMVCWSHGGRWGTFALTCPEIDFSAARSWGQSNAGPDMLDPNGPIVTLVRMTQSKN